MVTMAVVLNECKGAQGGDCLGVESAVSEVVLSLLVTQGNVVYMVTLFFIVEMCLLVVYWRLVLSIILCSLYFEPV